MNLTFVSGNYGKFVSVRDSFMEEGIDINYLDYDSNKDGYVDGIWFIYNAKDQKEVYDERDFSYAFIRNEFLLVF